MRQSFLLPIFTCLLAVGCAGEPEMARVADLAAQLPEAEALAEASGFVIGTPGLEPELLGGWSYGEVDRGRNRTFRWARRPRSGLAFTALDPRPLTLVLEGLTAPGAKAAEALAVELNGRTVGALEVEPGLAEYRLPIAAGDLLPGRNELALVYDDSGAAPGDPGSDRRPDVAMAWYRIALAGLDDAAGEPRTDERGRLFLPLGSRLGYSLAVPDGAQLRVASARRTAGAGRLAIGIERDGAPAERLTTLDGGDEIVVALGAPSGPVRLTLSALADPPTQPGSESGRPEGFLLDAPTVFAPPGRAETTAYRARGSRPNIIIYLVDTLRRDRLGCYGHDRAVSPNLDRFAAGATLFENARAQSSWTLPAVTSLFTGVWPPAHGVVLPSGKLPAEAVTMAEILGEAGYTTSAIVANGFVRPDWGLAQGFESHLRLGPGDRDSRRVFEETVDWLERRDRSRPFFLYLHTLDPHNPYLPKEEYRRRFAAEAEDVYQAILANPKRTRWEATESNVEQLFALYDALIAQNDAEFGRTLEALETRGLYEDSLIVFLADHGEEFFEHRAWTHGSNLFSPTLDVPLVLKLPGQTAGRRVTRVAQQVDVLPTLLDVLGLEAPARLDGRSLLADARGKAPAVPAPPVFSHTSRYGRETRSAVESDWKYIERLEADRLDRWLFGWNRHPDPGRNRLDANRIRAEALRLAIGRELARPPLATPEEAVLDESTRDDLRALGYIE